MTDENMLELDANVGAPAYKFDRQVDTGKWFRAAVQKAKVHVTAAGSKSIRVLYRVDAEYTDPDTKIPGPAPLLVSEFVPQGGDAKVGGMRREFFASLGIDDSGNGSPNGKFRVDLDDLYALESFVKLKTEEYQGSQRPKILDKKAIKPGFEKVRRVDMATKKVEDDADIPFEVPQ